MERCDITFQSIGQNVGWTVGLSICLVVSPYIYNGAEQLRSNCDSALGVNQLIEMKDASKIYGAPHIGLQPKACPQRLLRVGV